LDNLKERTGYWKLKEEALDITLWRTCCGRGYGPVVRQVTQLMNEIATNELRRITQTKIINCNKITEFKNLSRFLIKLNANWKTKWKK
jgi:hypothetical protein